MPALVPAPGMPRPDLPAPVAGTSWPPGTSWAWRPALWTGEARPADGAVASGDPLSDGIKVFHDAGPGAVDVSPGDPGLLLETGRQAGSFVSLVLDLPDAALPVIHPRALLTLGAVAELEGVGSVDGRVNLRHGPNVAQQVRPARRDCAYLEVAFDFAHVSLDHAPIRQIWVDLIFSDPDRARIHISDLTLACRPRAEL